MRSSKTLLALAVATGSLFTFTSCETHTQTGALAGGAGGAALGALVDKDNRGRGALIGGAAGTVAGGLVGKEQDDRARDAYYRGY